MTFEKLVYVNAMRDALTAVSCYLFEPFERGVSHKETMRVHLYGAIIETLVCILLQHGVIAVGTLEEILDAMKQLCPNLYWQLPTVIVNCGLRLQDDIETGSNDITSSEELALISALLSMLRLNVSNDHPYNPHWFGCMYYSDNEVEFTPVNFNTEGEKL